MSAPRDAGDYALKRLDLTWEDGGAYALLGPSGCGKTTLLNIISGLLTPSEGDVLFDGVPVTALAPEQRNIAQVFQFPVVYDSMSVYDNLAFPLKNRGRKKDDIDHRVRELADMLELSDMLTRKASGLTADAKQKISLGRGLIREHVNAILFDEPLTVIDPHLKWLLRSQLKHLHRRFAHTMIYVTHDQTEALTFADTVVVMYEGEVVQIGTPQELFERPAHTFVGYFIGSPGMNVLPCELREGAAMVGRHRIDLSGRYARMPDAANKLEVGVRPEFVDVLRGGAGDMGGGLPVDIERVDDIGRHRVVRMRLDGLPLNALVPEEREVPADGATVRFRPDHVNLYADNHLWPREG